MSLNNFELIKVLGKGAFGQVCLVKRNKDGNKYAMKRVKILKSSEPEIEGELNEIRLLSSLNHINVIGYKEAFYDKPSNTLNIVMEYADGGDLAKRIEINKKRCSLFDENLIWEWVFQLLYGVSFLHSHHIIHRDLKTANIFLMKNDILKIGDLNVSKLAKKGYARTKTGTPICIAPEVWDNQAYDYKCDIWSLGCVIYEICTLSPPFNGINLKQLISNIKSGKFNPISSYYSNDLKQIIDWMLVVNPNMRKSSKELLYSDIIRRKIKTISRKDIIDKVVKTFYSCDLKKTIIMPRKINKINKVLPKENYEMGENDHYINNKETQKEKIITDKIIINNNKPVIEKFEYKKPNRKKKG